VFGPEVYIHRLFISVVKVFQVCSRKGAACDSTTRNPIDSPLAIMSPCGGARPLDPLSRLVKAR
jgi:hypothetical protein